jgi:hypothetical protein
MRGPKEVLSSHGCGGARVRKRSMEGRERWTYVSDGAGFGLGDEHGEELVVDFLFRLSVDGRGNREGGTNLVDVDSSTSAAILSRASISESVMIQ